MRGLAIIVIVLSIAPVTRAQLEPDTLENSGVGHLLVEPATEWFDEPILQVMDGPVPGIAERRLEDLIASSERGSELWARYVFRLAELHMDHALLFEQRAIERKELALESRSTDAARTSQYERDALADLAERDRLARRVFELTAEIDTSSLGGFEDADELLYLAGRSAHQLGLIPDSDRALTELVDTFPASEHTPFAYSVLADHRLDEGDRTGAASLFGRVVEHPESPYFAYAMYRLGRLRADDGQIRDALLSLDAAVDAAQGDQPELELFRGAVARSMADVVVTARESHPLSDEIDAVVQERGCPFVNRLIAGLAATEHADLAHEILLSYQTRCGIGAESRQ